MDGVEQCGGAGRWQEIKRLEYHALTLRSAVDLKDKWRNLLRVANLPSTHSLVKDNKKREAPSAEILSRVSRSPPLSLPMVVVVIFEYGNLVGPAQELSWEGKSMLWS